MFVKRFSLLLCFLSLTALCACSEPVNEPPYESPSIDNEIDNSYEQTGDSTAEKSDNDVATTTTYNPNEADTDSAQSSHITKKTTSGKSSSKTTKATDNQVNWEDIYKEDSTTSKNSSTSTVPTTLPTQQEDSTTSKNSSTSTAPTTQPTQQDEIKGVSLPAEGYSPDGKIQIGTVKLVGNTVSMEIKNITTKYQTNQDDYFEYTCYDKDGKELKCDKIYFGRIYKQQSRVCTFTIPDNTIAVELTNLKVEYWSDFF